MIRPRRPAPALEVPTLSGETWRLAERQPREFTLIVVYRGLHCPICRGYLADLDRKVDAFLERGTEVLAVSTDERGRAEQTRRDWGLQRLDLGYGLDLDTARTWQLYVSTSIKPSEPPRFAEPGLFLVRTGGTLYAASIQTMPFARPDFDQLLKALDFILENDYPARGED